MVRYQWRIPSPSPNGRDAANTQPSSQSEKFHFPDDIDASFRGGVPRPPKKPLFPEDIDAAFRGSSSKAASSTPAVTSPAPTTPPRAATASSLVLAADGRRTPSPQRAPERRVAREALATEASREDVAKEGGGEARPGEVL